MTKPIDYQFCILSQGKSLFDAPCVIPLASFETPEIKEDAQAVESLRALIAIMRETENNMTEETQQVVYFDFRK